MKNENPLKAMELTNKIAEKVVSLGYDDISDAQRKCGRQLVADAVAVAVAGSVEGKPPNILSAVAKETGGNEQASVIGQGFKTSVEQAAMINGAAIHVLDFEPVWQPPNHLQSTILPAAMALIEQKQEDGKTLLASFIKGVELACAMRFASKQVDVEYCSFHPPGMIGPIGSVTAAGSVLGLDVKQMRNAFGIAASRCGGLLANSGTHTKCMHCAMSSFTGVDAALLAAKGYSASETVFEAYKGYIEAFFTPSTFAPDVLLSYGERSFILDYGYEIKLYPCNFFTHMGVNAALEVQDKIKDCNDIQSIHIVGPYHGYLNRPFPKSGLDGKFSIQYQVVCTLLDGTVSIDTFTDKRRFSPDVERLLGLIEYEMAQDNRAINNQSHVDLTIRMKDGTELHSIGYTPRNNKFGSHVISREEHTPKLMDCLTRKMNDANAREVIEMAYSLDLLNSKDLSHFFDLLRC